MASSSTTPSTRPSTSRSTGKAPDRPASLRSTPAAAMTATADDTVLEAILRRDRQFVVAALIIVIAMAWLWTLLGAGTGMSAMDVIVGPSSDHMASIMAPALWTAGYAGIIFTMWWVMMAAMMLPSAGPILLLFARINRKEKSAGRPFIPTGIFAAGYLIAWGAFSAVATGLQWAFEQLGLLSPMMVTTSYSLGGAILLAAGVWQLTPIKGICLRHCRSPMGFFVQSWRPGRGGALRMGLEHGSFCLGCCWFLMGLLFFGGIMNLEVLEREMVEGGEKGVGRVAQSALQHAARLCAAVALTFEAADDVQCLLHIAYDRANIDLRRLARQPYAAFIAAD